MEINTAIEMEMARVIVDVPSKDTDRPFDYLIPAHLRPWIEVGSRVGVPFGHRTLQGFVVSVHPRPEMETAKMKAIQEVLDVMPPLSSELIRLGEWMRDRYACRHITALQSMLPTALKGKAERYVSLGETESETRGADDLLALLPESEWEAQILAYVGSKGEVSLQQLTRLIRIMRVTLNH
ncbi:helicase PriA essential for oriC/DnaA-independent DNA replication [Paenibacillus sp. JCM 10914]|nr:helicase PriA essential for oriC/DnaA-independent DNA replication [Paenibacillus sp. JCM 10914]